MLIDIINKMTPESLVQLLTDIAAKKGYSIFNKGDYNLNIWNIRSTSKLSNSFDDVQVIFYYDNDKLKVKTFRITTDPGKDSLLKPRNSSGTFILKPNQYKGCWKLGYHKGKTDHPALVQIAPVTGYRDRNKNDILDMDDRTIVTGMYGINCHRASAWRLLEYVGLYSEGCQVHYDPNRYNKEFISLIQDAIECHGNRFTITLITEKDLYE